MSSKNSIAYIGFPIKLGKPSFIGCMYVAVSGITYSSGNIFCFFVLFGAEWCLTENKHLYFAIGCFLTIAGERPNIIFGSFPQRVTGLNTAFILVF